MQSSAQTRKRFDTPNVLCNALPSPFLPRALPFALSVNVGSPTSCMSAIPAVHLHGIPIAFILTSCSAKKDLTMWMKSLHASLTAEMSAWRPNAFIVDCAPSKINSLRLVLLSQNSSPSQFHVQLPSQVDVVPLLQICVAFNKDLPLLVARSPSLEKAGFY